MLHGRSAIAFLSSISSGAASSRCLLGLQRRLSPLLSLRGWTATTACSSACLLDGLQSVLNAAARLICNRRKYDHVTPLLRDVLHWLLVPFGIEYKLCLLVFQSLHGAAPEYLRGFHDNSSTDISSTTHRLQTFRLQTFRLLLYTSVQDSYTSNFCFSKSLFSSIPPSTYTYTTIRFFIKPTSTDTMIIQHA